MLGTYVLQPVFAELRLQMDPYCRFIMFISPRFDVSGNIFPQPLVRKLGEPYVFLLHAVLNLDLTSVQQLLGALLVAPSGLPPAPASSVLVDRGVPGASVLAGLVSYVTHSRLLLIGG